MPTGHRRRPCLTLVSWRLARVAGMGPRMGLGRGRGWVGGPSICNGQGRGGEGVVPTGSGGLDRLGFWLARRVSVSHQCLSLIHTWLDISPAGVRRRRGRAVTVASNMCQLSTAQRSWARSTIYDPTTGECSSAFIRDPLRPFIPRPHRKPKLRVW